ncbi:MAG: PQQ-dependent sugar dehydrogenase [Acidobacteria bacterium]|nr:PQQ-dependent sugar dehydrogenase [Acidobacteriota bacterium]
MRTFTRIVTGAAAAAALSIAVPSPGGAPAPAQGSASRVTLEGFGQVRTNDQDSTYSQGLTHRYVDGELRFLSLTLQRQLHEFRPPASGQTETQTTATWDLSGTGAFFPGFHGIWFEQAKNRLWITSTEDYTATNRPARVTLVELGNARSVRVLKQFSLDVPAKRVYGGCQAVPQPLVAQLGGPYVCGWGGYTSLVMQGGSASIGPTMYAIPDPDTVANGATVNARTILDAADAQTHRGIRKTIPQNYFDGGDPRQNPPTRPTSPPLTSGRWLSPNSEGFGWMVWGDSYYNTGFWIGTTFGAVASLCKGACWYQSSTLAFDGRQFELHLWNGSALGTNILARPSHMEELVVPIDPSRQGGGPMGNRTVGNLAGATYDPVSKRLYVIGFAMGDAYTARLYSFVVNEQGSGGPPAVPPVDAVVSDWSPWTPMGDWSPCADGVRTRREERTRTILTPASNGGVTPSLTESRTATSSCGVRQTLTARLVAGGFDRPIGIVQHRSDVSAQLVLEQAGRIKVLRGDQVGPTPFLDLSSVTGVSSTQGLSGLAFAPDFAASGRVYVSFHDRAGNLVVARFERAAGDPLRVDPTTRFDLRWPDGARFVTQPATTDSSAHLAFGPDGFLYVSFGQAGGGGDAVHVSQHPRSLLGKMLRLDTNVSASDPIGYRVPASNPYAGSNDVLPEIWAFGLRNPQGWTFDRSGTGALIVPDAGDVVQEVSYVPTGAGGWNLGWPRRQGRRDHLATAATFGAALRDAVWDYDAGLGQAIIGGEVYRGSALGAAYRGRVFFGDFRSNRIWSMLIDETGATALDVTDHSAEFAAAAVAPSSIGADAAGEIYVVSYLGGVYRLETVGSSGGRSGTGEPVGRARPRDR